MKNPYIIPAAMICAAILAGFWILKPSSEQPQKVIVVQRPDISIHIATKAGHIEAVKQAIAAGADVNAKNLSEWTPLHNAAQDGHKEIAELLIAKGANVNAIIQSGSFEGMTPLDTAINWKRPETANLLRKHGGKTGEELKAEGK